MKKRNGKFIKIVLLSILITSTSCFANFNFTDFGSMTDLSLVGNSSLYENRLRLTPATSYKVGGAWYSTKQQVQKGFSCTFQWQITGPLGSDGADGFAFVIQNQGSDALGGRGGYIGYGGTDPGVPRDGIQKSIAIEFDTAPVNPDFGDPESTHISVQSRGDLPNSPDHLYSLGCAANILSLDDENQHIARIDYSLGLLSIFIDNQKILDVSINLDSTLSLDYGRAWVGFTAGTGSHYENHDILNWSFTEIPEPATLLLLTLGGLALRRRK